MKNVLVFPCGSEIGLEVNRALSKSKHFRLFGASSTPDHGRLVYQNYIENVPFVTNSNFISSINDICVKNKIDFIVPAHDSVVLSLSENAANLKAKVVTSCYETCKLCRSKRDTYLKFIDVVPVPKVYNINDCIQFPVFLKPDVGQGAKGTYKANRPEDILYHTSKDNTLMVLEYLPGKEYTIDCFTNKDGNLLFCEGRCRERINNGITNSSKLVKNDKFKEIAEKINSALSFRGMWFFQVKEDLNNQLTLMEISPRIAGTMGLFRTMGVNFVELSLFDQMDMDVDILFNEIDIELDKALSLKYKLKRDYQNVYIDFDDTIICDGVINTDVMKYLYQASNDGKRIILLTKHKGNVIDSLEGHKIHPRLFNSIVHIQPKEKKSDYIKFENSIFIDDSFSERKSVHEAHKIPVFSVDAIEALIDWRS